MKICSAYSVLLLGLVGFACSDNSTPTPTDAGAPDAGETPDECMPDCVLTFDATMQAMGSDYVSFVGDSDGWTFTSQATPQSTRVVNIVVTNDADFSPIRLEVVLFGPDQTALVNRRFSGNGRQRVEIQRVIDAPGEYRVVVRDVGNDQVDRNNPYFITVTEFTDIDNNEPNNEPGIATGLTVGVPVQGAIGEQGDLDWFAIDVAANQLVQIDMVAAGISAVRFRWTLFDPTGATPLASSDEPTADDAPWPIENRAVGAEAGRYLIRVEDFPDDGPDADLERGYQLTVNLLAQPDVQEQAGLNDTRQTATGMQPGQTITGYIASTSDFDYYRIAVTNVPQLIVIEAAMGGNSEVDLAFSLLAQDGETLICDERDGDLCRALRFVTDGAAEVANLRTSHLATTPGNYFLLVRDLQDNDFDTQRSYQVTMTQPAEPDVQENYLLEGRDGAVPIVASSTAGTTITYPWVEGYISHANDQDWYSFNIPGPEGAVPGQNGDWLVQIELQMPGPTPVELDTFFFGSIGADRERYGGYGQRCRDGSPNDPNPCQYPDEENVIDLLNGEISGDCFVIFRESTIAGPHYFRMTDLDRDDFDLSAQYRLRITVNAGCPATSVCSGMFSDRNGEDLCGRP